MGLDEFFGKMGLSVNPNARALDLYKKKQQSIDPFKQKMMEEYMMQKPGEDFSGIPGLEQIQNRFNKKLLDQGGPLYKPIKDKEGKVTGYSPKKGAKEKQDKETMLNPLQMTGSGPQRMTGQARKDQVFGKIQEKREAGQPISTAEARYEKKYLGIKDTKKLPESATEIEFIRNKVKDSLGAEIINQGGYYDKDSKTYYDAEGNVVRFPEEAIQAGMPEFTKRFYPNADPVEIEKKDYTIKLPEGMDTIGKAREYLSKFFDNPEEIDAWIEENVEAE